MLTIRLISVLLGGFIAGYYSCLINQSNQVSSLFYLIVVCQVITTLFNCALIVYEDHRRTKKMKNQGLM